MTESRWPNDYDRKFWTWPKNSLWLTLTFELDQKYNKYYHNDEHKQVNMTENQKYNLNSDTSKEFWFSWFFYINIFLVKFIHISVKFKS